MTMITKCNHYNMLFFMYSNDTICHHDMIFRIISKRWCICSISHCKGQVLTHSNFPFDFDTIFNFLYRSHDMILIKLSDGNRTLTNFRKLFRFDFWHSTYVFTWYYFCRNHIEKKNWIQNLTENCTVWRNLNM
jgi:hypothetical protein